MAVRLLRPAKCIANSSVLPTYRNFHASSSNMVVTSISSKADFREAIKKPAAIFDVFATWCGPCKSIAPILAKLSDQPENKGIAFFKIDIDEVADVSQELSIRSVPTFVFFKHGGIAKVLVGASPPALGKAVEELAKEFPPFQSKAGEASKK